MRQFRLIGSERTMIVAAHSSLDVGARIKSDPDFYYVGLLETIEDMGGLVVARVTAKGRIIPVSKTNAKSKKEPKEKRARPDKLRREKIVRKEFKFDF